MVPGLGGEIPSKNNDSSFQPRAVLDETDTDTHKALPETGFFTPKRQFIELISQTMAQFFESPKLTKLLKVKNRNSTIIKLLYHDPWTVLFWF